MWLQLFQGECRTWENNIMKKNKLPNIISILILTLMTIVLWISLTVYRAFTAKPAESVPQTVSAPITPTLNQGVVKQIESSIYLTGSEIPEDVTTNPSPQPTPNIETPVASPSATPVASPSATPA